MANGNAINVGQFDADASADAHADGDALPMQCECPWRSTLSVCVCVCGCLCGVSEIYSQQFFAYFSIVFNWQRAEFTTTEEHMQRLLRTDGRTDRGRQVSGAAATKYLWVALSLLGLICCLPF